MKLTRRSALLYAPLVALGGCTFSSANGVTSVTVNLTDVKAYVTAASNFVTNILANSTIAGLLGATMAANLKTWIADANTALANLVTQNGGSLTLTVDTTAVPAFLTSVMTDIQDIFNGVQSVFSTVGITFPSDISDAWTAFQTIVQLVLALVPTFAVPYAVARIHTGLTKQQALSILGVR